MRPCTVSGLGNLGFADQGLGAYAVDTTDYFGDASDLNAAPPPPAPADTGPSPLMLTALALGAWFLLKGNF